MNAPLRVKPAALTVRPGQLCQVRKDDIDHVAVFLYWGRHEASGLHLMKVVNDTTVLEFEDSEFAQVEPLFEYKDTMSGLVERSGQWADSVFPNRKPWDTLVRLSMRELPELYAKPDDGSEVADAIILAADVGYQQGMDVETFVRDKIALNERRRWEFRDDGLLYHVKGEPEDGQTG